MQQKNVNLDNLLPEIGLQIDNEKFIDILSLSYFDIRDAEIIFELGEWDEELMDILFKEKHMGTICVYFYSDKGKLIRKCFSSCHISAELEICPTEEIKIRVVMEECWPKNG